MVSRLCCLPIHYRSLDSSWAGFAFLLFIAWQLARSHPHVARVAGHLKCTTEGRNRGVQNTPLLGYIGTEIAYHPKRLQVEPGVSLVDPKTESTLMDRDKATTSGLTRR